jgi:DNA-3-methyladenine glycosylase I
MSTEKPDLLHHPDGRARCWWPGTDPVYVAYHDEEWGVPERDGRALFEKLLLDGFQAGLSWITILKRRESLRRAFDGFVPETIAAYGPDKIERLMADPGIIRNRAKVVGAVASARVFLDIEAKEGFSHYLWKHVGGRALQPDLATRVSAPTESDISRTISKDLKKRGFTFCGPTIVYAFMQAVGMTNDHLTGCFRHAEVAAMAER